MQSQKILYAVLLSIISIVVLGSFLRTNIDGYEKAMFMEMIEGTAHKPFVTRCLVPVIVKASSSLLPGEFKAELNEWGKVNINYLTSRGNNIDLTELLIALAVWFASIIGFAVMMIKFARLFYSADDKALYLISIVSAAGLPIFFKYYSYIYDFTHLFLFTLGLYLLAKSKWGPYLFLLGIATLSKETSVLLIIIFYIHYKQKLNSKEFNRLLFIQIVIFILLKALVTFIFLDNPGNFVEFHLHHTLTLEPYSISQFIAFVLIGIAVGYGWKNKPEFLKVSAYMIVPLIAFAFFLGFIDEYRDYYEVYPVFILLISHTVMKFIAPGHFEVKKP